MMDMDGFGKVKQAIIPVGKAPRSGPVYPHDIPEGMTHANCIYIDGSDGIEIVAEAGFGREYPPDIELSDEPQYITKFTELLREHRPADFGDVVYLLDVYHPKLISPDWEIEVAPAWTGLRSPLGASLECMLKNSGGHCLWDYQLENILGLFVDFKKERQAWRKDINKKKPEALERLERITIEDGLTLGRFVEERMRCGECNYITRAPNCRGAYLLSRVLFPQTIDGK